WTSPTGRKYITEPATIIQAGVNDNLTRALNTTARDEDRENEKDDDEPPPF
ncbi:hypothetical protein ABIB15_002969, partial [Marisediminicola sp. UYEF4]